MSRDTLAGDRGTVTRDTITDASRGTRGPSMAPRDTYAGDRGASMAPSSRDTYRGASRVESTMPRDSRAPSMAGGPRDPRAPSMMPRDSRAASQYDPGYQSDGGAIRSSRAASRVASKAY